MSKASPKRVIVMPSADENRKILAAATGDPDARPLTAAQLKAMVPLKAVRGRPPLESKKQLVSVRYSPEVLEFFRATGAGWQSRMDGVLKEYIQKRRPAVKTRGLTTRSS
jgi:uncharacterized protein (DUF4415 family)